MGRNLADSNIRLVRLVFPVMSHCHVSLDLMLKSSAPFPRFPPQKEWLRLSLMTRKDGMDLVGCPTERSEVHETQSKDEKGFKFQDGDKLR